jgi:hypothetical protein
MKKIFGYFDSEWSFAKFKVPDGRTLCAFNPEDNLIVVSMEGNYYLAEFNTKSGGDCKKKDERRIFTSID